MEREAGGLLSGNVFDRFSGRLGGLRLRTTFQREDDLADFDLVAFFDLDLFHDSADRGRNFDDGFVGLEFHHRLTFGDLRSGSDHQAHQIALIDVLAEFGKLEFGSGRSGALQPD